jgi:hypothetical protein
MEKQKLNTLYKCRCSEVTLDEFIDCLLNDNYLRLLKSPAGTPEATPDEQDSMAQQAWGLLYQDYVKQSGGKKNLYLFTLYRRIALLDTRIKVAGMILKEALPDEERAKLLNMVNYTGNINGIVTNIKRDSVLLSGAITEWNKAKEGTSEENMTERDFTRWMVSVSKFMGYRIDKRSVTVEEFLEMNREWEESVNAKKKQYGKQQKQHGKQ